MITEAQKKAAKLMQYEARRDFLRQHVAVVAKKTKIPYNALKTNIQASKSHKERIEAYQSEISSLENYLNEIKTKSLEQKPYINIVLAAKLGEDSEGISRTTSKRFGQLAQGRDPFVHLDETGVRLVWKSKQDAENFMAALIAHGLSPKIMQEGLNNEEVPENMRQLADTEKYQGASCYTVRVPHLQIEQLVALAQYHPYNCEAVVREWYAARKLDRPQLLGQEIDKAPKQKETNASIYQTEALRVKYSDTHDLVRLTVAAQDTRSDEKIKKKHHVVILLDDSGSMQGPKMTAANEALQQFLESLDDDTLVSIQPFNAKTLANQVPAKKIKEQVSQYCNTPATGGTPLVQVLASSAVFLREQNGADNIISTEELNNTTIALLTDGQDSSNGSGSQALIAMQESEYHSALLLPALDVPGINSDNFISYGLPGFGCRQLPVIFPISIGSDSDANFMNTLATSLKTPQAYVDQSNVNTGIQVAINYLKQMRGRVGRAFIGISYQTGGKEVSVGQEEQNLFFGRTRDVYITVPKDAKDFEMFQMVDESYEKEAQPALASVTTDPEITKTVCNAYVEQQLVELKLTFDQDVSDITADMSTHSDGSFSTRGALSRGGILNPPGRGDFSRGNISRGNISNNLPLHHSAKQNQPIDILAESAKAVAAAKQAKDAATKAAQALEIYKIAKTALESANKNEAEQETKNATKAHEEAKKAAKEAQEAAAAAADAYNKVFDASEKVEEDKVDEHLKANQAKETQNPTSSAIIKAFKIFAPKSPENNTQHQKIPAPTKQVIGEAVTKAGTAAEEASESSSTATSILADIDNYSKIVALDVLKKATIDQLKMMQKVCDNAQILNDIQLFIQKIQKADIKRPQIDQFKPTREQIAQQTQIRLGQQAVPKAEIEAKKKAKAKLDGNKTALKTVDDVVALIKGDSLAAAIDLLKANPGLMNQKSTDKFLTTPLIFVIAYMQDKYKAETIAFREFINEIINLKDVDFTLQDNTGNTVLHRAAWSGEFDLCKQLIIKAKTANQLDALKKVKNNTSVGATTGETVFDNIRHTGNTRLTVEQKKELQKLMGTKIDFILSSELDLAKKCSQSPVYLNHHEDKNWNTMLMLLLQMIPAAKTIQEKQQLRAQVHELLDNHWQQIDFTEANFNGDTALHNAIWFQEYALARKIVTLASLKNPSQLEAVLAARNTIGQDVIIGATTKTFRGGEVPHMNLAAQGKESLRAFGISHGKALPVIMLSVMNAPDLIEDGEPITLETLIGKIISRMKLELIYVDHEDDTSETEILMASIAALTELLSSYNQLRAWLEVSASIKSGLAPQQLTELNHLLTVHGKEFEGYNSMSFLESSPINALEKLINKIQDPKYKSITAAQILKSLLVKLRAQCSNETLMDALNFVQSNLDNLPQSEGVIGASLPANISNELLRQLYTDAYDILNRYKGYMSGEVATLNDFIESVYSTQPKVKEREVNEDVKNAEEAIFVF